VSTTDGNLSLMRDSRLGSACGMQFASRGTPRVVSHHKVFSIRHCALSADPARTHLQIAQCRVGVWSTQRKQGTALNQDMPWQVIASDRTPRIDRISPIWQWMLDARPLQTDPLIRRAVPSYTITSWWAARCMSLCAWETTRNVWRPHGSSRSPLFASNHRARSEHFDHAENYVLLRICVSFPYTTNPLSPVGCGVDTA